MTRRPATLIAMALALALVCATIALPVSAMAATTAPDLPGAPLPASPTTGSIDAAGVADAVYRIELAEGDKFGAQLLDWPNGTEFGLRLYSATDTSVADSVPDYPFPGLPPVTSNIGFTETLPRTTRYLAVHAFSGAGVYWLSYELKRVTKLSVGRSPAVIPYGGTSKLTGSLRNSFDQPLAGRYVKVDLSYDGTNWTSGWRTLKLSSSGTLSYSVKPQRKTWYRLRFPGDSTGQPSVSAKVLVSPRCYLGTPSAPSTMTRGRTYAVAGDFKPKQPVGTSLARVQAYRYEGGGWVLRYTYTARNSNYSTYSRYSASARITLKGRYRIRAYVPENSKYMSSSSAWKYVTVP